MPPWTTRDDQNGRPIERDMSDFLLRACHDLRTPLRAIHAHAELLRKTENPQSAADFDQRLGFIVDGAQRMNLLLDGLASYSISLRLEEQSFQPTQMEVILRLALAKLRKELTESQAEVAYDPLPSVTGDPDRLAQLLENLVLNAIRHRGSNPPRVHVSVTKQADSYVFAVRDNGPGIESAYLERVFAPFERLCGKELPGPGLGLAISREIVERHGGRIWVESTLGSGSTFFFTLPAA